MIKYNWPSREEWAHRRRHQYWDCETGCPFAKKYSHALSDYATADEIADAIMRLDELWRKHGREMSKLNRKIVGLKMQNKDEDEISYGRRLIANAKVEMEIETLKWERYYIKKILAELRKNKLGYLNIYCGAGEAAMALVVSFEERYKAAHNAAEEEWQRECEMIPVGDAEWEEELQYRRETEDRDRDDAAHPERFIHHV
jgi:hypothetical protein